MTDSVLNLAIRLLNVVSRTDYATALILVALAALGVAALSLWTLTVIVKTLTARRK